MIDPQEFRTLVIKPVLAHLGTKYATKEAVDILLATALAESNLSHLKQVHGPALGLYQMEWATFDDLQLSYLRYHPKLSEKFAQCFFPAAPWLTQFPSNLWAQTAAARLQYWRDSKPLPTEPEAMAEYYLRVWNTPAGKATLSKVLWAFRKAVEY